LRRQDRLDHVIKQPDPDRLDRRLHRRVAGHQDAVRARRQLLELPQQIEPAPILEPQVGDHHIKRIRPHRLGRLLDRTGSQGRVALGTEIIDQHAP